MVPLAFGSGHFGPGENHSSGEERNSIDAREELKGILPAGDGEGTQGVEEPRKTAKKHVAGLLDSGSNPCRL